MLHVSRRLLSPALRPSLARAFRPARTRFFTVLALESSADDTCAAVVTSDRKILSNVVISQQAFLEEYGGIHPFVALHAHQRNMPVAVQRALREANLTAHDVDGVAFTLGPGIPGCLSVCGNAARSLAAALNKPLVGVHHMQAHALTPLLTSPPDSLPRFPFLTLLVSGGHTLLLLARAPASFRILATTLDESIGNAYDKVARLLGVPFDGTSAGAALERYCAQPSAPSSPSSPPTPGVDTEADDSTSTPDVRMPRPMPGRLAFSYTGLHSTVERFLDARRGTVDERTRHALARSFQRAAVGQLEEKLVLGMRLCARQGVRPRALVVSGGVASNSYLRKRLRVCLDEESPDEQIPLVFPPPSLCTDNAVMIAWASMNRFLRGDTDEYSIESRPKWSLEELDESSAKESGS